MGKISVWLGLWVLLLPGCGGETDLVQITFRVAQADRLLAVPLPGFPRLRGPVTALDHACLLLNVAANDISRQAVLPDGFDGDCVGLGAVSSLKSPTEIQNEGVSITVSKGTGRRVQLLGLDAMECLNGDLSDTLASQAAVLNLLGEDVVHLTDDAVVTLENAYSPGGPSLFEGCVTPSISNVSPGLAGLTGGRELTVTGKGFVLDLGAQVGDLGEELDCFPKVVSPTQFTCVSVANSGLHDLVVTNPGVPPFRHADAVTLTGAGEISISDFSSQTAVAVSLFDSTAVGTVDGKLIVGGNGGAGALQFVVQTNEVANTWTAVADGISTSSVDHATASLNDNFYVTVADGSSLVNYVLEGNGFNPSTSVFVSVASNFTGSPVLTPFLGAYQSRLWLAFAQGSPSQIRVYELSANQTTWIPRSTGSLNKSPSEAASAPHLHAYRGKLYATWQEVAAGKTQVRVARYGGGSDWEFVDGNGVGGINLDQDKPAFAPRLATHNSKLYVVWSESDGSNNEIVGRVWEENGWAEISEGYKTNFGEEDASQVSLFSMGGYLYVLWQEQDGAATKIHLKRYDGIDTPSSAPFVVVDSSSLNEDTLDIDTDVEGDQPKAVTFAGRMYVFYREEDPSDQSKIHVRRATLP